MQYPFYKNERYGFHIGTSSMTNIVGFKINADKRTVELKELVDETFFINLNKEDMEFLISQLTKIKNQLI